MTWAKAALVAALGAAGGAAAVGGLTRERDAEVVAHTVYFTMKESTRENIDKCIAACKKYASKHEGLILFACGERAEPPAMPISDKDFHVAQVLIFTSREALEKYSKSEDRQKFVAEGRPLWSKVRVFETNLRGLETPGLKRADAPTP